MSKLLAVTDRTDSARSAIVDADTVAPVVAQWLAADGGAPAHNVDALARALRAGNWSRVHALADHLSIDVDLLA